MVDDGVSGLDDTSLPAVGPLALTATSVAFVTGSGSADRLIGSTTEITISLAEAA